MSTNSMQYFQLDNKVIVITGGAGLLGRKHAEAIVEAGGTPVLLDLNEKLLAEVAGDMSKAYNKDVVGIKCDITNKNEINQSLDTILQKFGRLDGLVNNAANDPKVDPGADAQKLTRFENISQDYWQNDVAVGLTGAFLCSQVFGHYMATNGGGVIVNIASDLAIISPDQRIYRVEGRAEDEQPVKPVTYSVIKAGLVGMTKYLATYWCENNVRVNAISPGGVYNGQNEEFVEKLTYRIPMARMAHQDEYKASLIYLLSDASSYMTGFNLVIDGGRSCW
jgi:NAD(P)-dependent dehydrogenase (short-subunit alcohol dehydrogenase family)